MTETVVRRVRRHLQEKSSPNEEHEPAALFDPWQTYMVPPFPLETLPPVLVDFVEFEARNIGADPSAIAMAALAACSGALDHTFALRMMEHGGWRANPRLWVTLIGAVSSKKTPLMRACLEPIRIAQSKLVKRHRTEMAAWEAAKDALKSGQDKPMQPEPSLRFIANDITIEKVAELLSRPGQERGLLIEADELAGWLGSMEKYNRGRGGAMADRAFWLKAYNGGPHDVDRIGRPTLHLENCSVSILGGIQPERLAEIGNNLQSDGLLQRFLPVMMIDATLPEDIPEGGAVAAYDTLMMRLAGLRGCAQLLQPDAMDAANEFRAKMYDVERLGMGDGLTSFVGKLPGVHGSLSLILHLAADPEAAMYGRVSAATVMAAERIIGEFIIPHAQVLYQGSFGGGSDDLRALCSFILTHDKDRFVASDFTSGVRGFRALEAAKLCQKVSVLVAGGWLVEEPGSIPARAWNVVPGLIEHFAEHRKVELSRKADALVALGHPALKSRA